MERPQATKDRQQKDPLLFPLHKKIRRYRTKVSI